MTFLLYNVFLKHLNRLPQQQHHLQHQPPPGLAQPKKTLTYGEYRRLRQEQERRLNPQQPQMGGQPPQGQGGPPGGLQQPVVMNRRDPRRQPKQVHMLFFFRFSGN